MEPKVGKFGAYFASMGTVTMELFRSHDNSYGWHVIAKGVTSGEMNVIREAQARGHPDNGGDIEVAKNVLKDAGAMCYWLKEPE